jgi:hypothetical protein
MCAPTPKSSTSRFSACARRISSQTGWSSRNILEYNTFDKTVGGNVLLTYRVNAGTVFFVGYDDHYRQGRSIDEALYPTSAMMRTNRAIFTKLQYLFRYRLSGELGAPTTMFYK